VFEKLKILLQKPIAKSNSHKPAFEPKAQKMQLKQIGPTDGTFAPTLDSVSWSQFKQMKI
jgi:hypothetical protein